MPEFERSLAKVLQSEGGYVNHPQDPGGATNRGVTQAVYDAYRDRKGLQRQSVRAIADTEVHEIYRASYWDLARCSELPPGVSYVVFDGAVNSGVKQSVRWLQRALAVRDDGVIGPTTIAAAKSVPAGQLIDAILARRLEFLRKLKTWPTFGRGWTSRLNDVRATAHGWIGSQPTLLLAPGGSAKAYEEDLKTAPSAVPGDAAASAGGMGAVISQSLNQLTPLSNIEFVAKIVAGLTVLSVLLLIGGLAYGQYARMKKARLKEVA